MRFAARYWVVALLIGSSCVQVLARLWPYQQLAELVVLSLLLLLGFELLARQNKAGCVVEKVGYIRQISFDAAYLRLVFLGLLLGFVGAVIE